MSDTNFNSCFVDARIDGSSLKFVKGDTSTYTLPLTDLQNRTAINSVHFNQSTMVFTFAAQDGSVKTIQLPTYPDYNDFDEVELIGSVLTFYSNGSASGAVNLASLITESVGNPIVDVDVNTVDTNNKKLVFTTASGSKQNVNISNLLDKDVLKSVAFNTSDKKLLFAQVDGDTTAIDLSSLIDLTDVKYDSDNFILKFYNKNLEYLSVDLSAVNNSTSLTREMNLRISGDTLLSTELFNESNLRISGDTSLSNKIEIEKSARILSDSSLTTAIQMINMTGATVLSTDLSSEKVIRSLADATLSATISLETSNRLSTDVVLSSNISTDITNLSNETSTRINEVSSRISTDNTLSSTISTEIIERISGDTSLTSRLSTEELLRISIDFSVSTKISNDYDIRLSNDIILSTTLSSEISSRTSIDISLSTKQSTETSIRSSADLTLFYSVSTETSNRTSVDTSLSNKLSTDINLKTSTDTVLSTLLSTETSLRMTGDTSLSNSLINENSIRISSDNLLSTNISTETTSRTSIDTSLSTKISSESSLRLSSDSLIINNLSSEVNLRITGDTSLSNKISTETYLRTSTDNILSSNISSEISTRTTLTTSLSTSMSNRISIDNSLSSTVSSIQGATMKWKGVFLDSTGLTTAYPSPTVGDYAWVGVSQETMVVYRCNVNGTWTATTDNPSQQELNLLNYYTKSEVDANTVGVSGNENIDGIKTFLQSPIIPSGVTQALNPTTKQYVDAADAQLGAEVSGNILYSANKTISAGAYRVVITNVPTIQEDKVGYIKVTGLNEGYVALATSGWSSVNVNFRGGEKIYYTIPSNRPNIVVANKDNEPLDVSTQISIEIGVDGINSLLGKEIEDSESFRKSIPFMDISKLYPTGGTDGTDVYTQTNARDIVPVDMREKGLILMYKTANGIVIEQYSRDDVSNTGWLYGTWHTLGISDILNLNTYHSKSEPYTDADEAKGAVPGYWRRGGIIIRFKLASGWITMQLNNDTWTTVEDKWQTIATNEDIGYLLETIRYSAIEYRLDKSDLINGYRANATSPVQSNKARVTTRELIKVNKGDIITLLDYNYSYSFSVWNDSLDTIIQNKEYNFSKSIVEQDGYLLLLVQSRTNPSATIDVADVYDKIIISRYGVFGKPNLEYVKSSDFIKGYIDADGHIQSHSTRFVNWRGMAVKKGDLVYAAVNALKFTVFEYNNNTGNKITDFTEYYQSTPTPFDSTNYCGVYVVKNDGYIICQCLDESETPDYDTFAKYNNGIVVIHIDNNSIRMLAEGVCKKTPTASKRGKSIVMPSTYGREMQSGTVVGDYLYIQVDNYKGQADSRKIVVINKETGALVKTLSTDLHGNMSYNAYNDTLLSSIDGKILLYKNTSAVDTSIMSSDADVIINLEEEEAMTYCWGEDNRTVYAVKSYDGSTPSTQTRWIFKKIILGIANGEYNGTYAVDKVYDGVVNEGIDTYHAKGQGNQNYIQDLDFDGYLYVAVGTSGHNFLVVDLDDHTSTFRVVGNYNHKYYDSNRVEHFLEPELVALDGGYIYCGSRSWSENIYELLKFTR